jgi:threonine aldolase
VTGFIDLGQLCIADAMTKHAKLTIVPGFQFASDNTAGACPEAVKTLLEANVGSVASYGDDAYTERVSERLREIFECDCEIFLVFNGTAANSLAISACCQSYHSVICSDVAHLETDECGGPEFFSGGAKILLADSQDGKLTPQSVEALITRRSDIHYPKPRVLSITQPSELGTLYTVEEAQALCEIARHYGLRVQMDGARLANAVAALNESPSQLTWKAGVDVLCLGGAKMGLPMGEAVVFFNHALAIDFAFRCKQAGQLASKMRFLTAPWLGILTDSAWLRHAAHANRMAQRLSRGLEQLPGARLLYPTEVNAVFASLPADCHRALAEKGWRYYTFIARGGARFMCSWATTEDDVDALLADIAGSLTSKGIIACKTRCS